MIVTWDTETRGLFGEIFIMGMYDGKEYKRVTPSRFLMELELMPEPVFAYAHNLDFDLAKLWKALNGIDIDWDKTVIIHHAVVRAKLKGREIYLCDSYKLFPASLEKLSTDFELKTPKLDLEKYMREKGFDKKEDFFKYIPENDPVLNEYLKHDCMALYELIQKAIGFSGLREEEFCKCPTLPALAMKIYQERFPEMYNLITENSLSKELEEIGRQAYIGARVEVVKPILTSGGYHYDVNSLYPYVMKVNSFPVGQYTKYEGSMAEFAYKVFKEGGFRHCLVQAEVYVPENLYIPPLPYRERKLLFPVGRFQGVWTGEELAMSEQYGVLVKPEKGFFWKEGEYIFKGFVEVMEKEKIESKGARRNFFKLIQNSLYGKFGMRREREGYLNEDKEDRLNQKGIPYLKIKLGCGKNVLLLMKNIRAKYIRPHIAAYVTSYARMVLYEAIMKNPYHVWYYDTDSLIIDYPLPAEMVDEKQYGKWKLEREIDKAIFLQPKLYAEKDKEGKEILKSKGLISDFRREMNFKMYWDILEAILKGQHEFTLYENIPARRKFISALKQGKEIDEPLLLRKSLNLLAKQKREIDYRANISKPLAVYTW